MISIIADGINVGISLARGNKEEAAFYAFAMIPFGNIIRRGAGPLSDGLGRLARSGVDGATTVATKLVKNIPVVGPWATKRVICPTRRAVGLPGCFVAGTPVLTPEGSKPIEELRAGDYVLSRSEFDVDAPVEARMVEEVFVRLSPTVDLHVGEQVIRTTTEHPIYVLGKGWVNVSLLTAGDVLVGHDGQQLTLREVRPTGDYEVVYNFRVEVHHTYFVGCDEWQFNLWVHNECERLTNARKNPTGGLSPQEEAFRDIILKRMPNVRIYRTQDGKGLGDFILVDMSNPRGKKALVVEIKNADRARDISASPRSDQIDEDLVKGLPGNPKLPRNIKQTGRAEIEGPSKFGVRVYSKKAKTMVEVGDQRLRSVIKQLFKSMK